MADAVKHPPGGNIASELRDLISFVKTTKTRVFFGGFFLTFLACTLFIALNPQYESSPWLNNVISSTAPVRSQFESFFSSLFNSPEVNPIQRPPFDGGLVTLKKNGTHSVVSGISGGTLNTSVAIAVNAGGSNCSVSLGETNDSVEGISERNGSWSVKSLVGCDIFHGRWVKDESYPLYKPGSCSIIDESFDCYGNGRPDFEYQRLRWQPFGCNIPRLNGKDMLEKLRGKRLVFVGDSLNRNMWESLVCILRNSIGDKSRVFEASGRHAFKTEGSYSFIFKDYKCSVEFFRSPFLVQEWETPGAGGKKKETLRLDIIEKSSSRYKDADIIVFNTGHWWTHDKTSKGKDYYQEGNRVYGELKVIEAFHKAMITWARWVDSNIDPRRTLVFFRGYSASHFSGGKWNSGGKCDHETAPITNESYITFYPPKMNVLEAVIHDMKTPVGYLNITTMTDYRKDAHPSIYRKKRLTAAERQDPDKYQDCSHWCLPGVPDSWNELLCAQILLKLSQKTG